MSAGSAQAAGVLPEPNNEWGGASGVDPFDAPTEHNGQVQRETHLGQVRGDVGTIPEPRPSLMGVTTHSRPFDKWSAEGMSGLHGAIVHRAGDGDHEGDMSPWQPQLTTERRAPTTAWDDGVTLASAPLADRL